MKENVGKSDCAESSANCGCSFVESGGGARSIRAYYDPLVALPSLEGQGAEDFGGNLQTGTGGGGTVRMRTIDQAHAELLSADPDCALAKTALRRMVVSGQLPSVRVGTKYLLDVDRLADFLFPAKESPAGGIRKQEARVW